MAFTSARRLGPLAAAALIALSVQIPAQAAGQGTWTKVTSPATGSQFLVRPASAAQLTITGQASADVPSVNVYCMFGSFPNAGSMLVATSVAVTGGAFQATVPYPNLSSGFPLCRLRALPTGVSTGADYLASYAGPVVGFHGYTLTTSGGNLFDFSLLGGSGTGYYQARSAGKCGDQQMGTVQSDLSAHAALSGCFLGLPPSNAAASHSTIRVDGHEGYLPTAEFQFGLNSSRQLGFATHLTKHGVTWTESATVERCAASDTFPPTAGTCPNLVSTGIVFHRSSTLLEDGHQIRIRDSFTSADGLRHHVALAYETSATPSATGAPGFSFPRQSGGIQGYAVGQAVSGVGRKAGVALVRSDRFSTDGDPSADTRALTWSRGPSQLAFSPTDANAFELGYALSVPKDAAAHLGFADSEAVTTPTAKVLAAAGLADMMESPVITSPDNRSVVKGRKTTVKGKVHAGANGLPVSVTVNGHAATLTPTGATTAHFKVTFKESLGKHLLTAVAKDAAGNSRSTSVKVRNIA